MLSSAVCVLDTITGVGEQPQRLLEPVGLGEDIVCVEGGNHEDADPVLCKDGGDLCKDPDQGEVQHALNPEGLPTVTSLEKLGGNEPGRADQGFLLIGRSGEDKRFTDVNLSVILQLADGKLLVDNLDRHAINTFLAPVAHVRRRLHARA